MTWTEDNILAIAFSCILRSLRTAIVKEVWVFLKKKAADKTIKRNMNTVAIYEGSRYQKKMFQ